MSLLIGLVIGLVLGLTGAGGSVFAVPLLVLLLGLPAQTAVGLSLGAVCVAASVGVLLRIKGQQIQWLPALIFVVCGAVAAPVGSRISTLMSETLLLSTFFLLVLVVSLRMWRMAQCSPEQVSVVRAQTEDLSVVQDPGGGAICGHESLTLTNFRWQCFVQTSIAAILAGLLSGIYGVGGGFVIVPVLVTILQIEIRKAVASSLLIIAVISAVGFSSFLLRNELPLSLLYSLALGGGLGMMVGLVLGKKIAGPILQKAFAVMMVLISAVMLLKFYT